MTINNFRKDNKEEFEKFPRLNKSKEQYDQSVERIEGDTKNILAEVEKNEAEETNQLGENAEEDVLENVEKKQELKDKIRQASNRLKPQENANLTDEDAKFIGSKEGFNTNYSCQTSVSEDQVI